MYMVTEQYKQQINDLLKEHIKIIKTGMETCPWCGQEVPVDKMTASVSRGVICRDCDLTFSN